jgi:hypothetical protein
LFLITSKTFYKKMGGGGGGVFFFKQQNPGFFLAYQVDYARFFSGIDYREAIGGCTAL